MRSTWKRVAVLALLVLGSAFWANRGLGSKDGDGLNRQPRRLPTPESDDHALAPAIELMHRGAWADAKAVLAELYRGSLEEPDVLPVGYLAVAACRSGDFVTGVSAALEYSCSVDILFGRQTCYVSDTKAAPRVNDALDSACLRRMCYDAAASYGGSAKEMPQVDRQLLRDLRDHVASACNVKLPAVSPAVR